MWYGSVTHPWFKVSVKNLPVVCVLYRQCDLHEQLQYLVFVHQATVTPLQELFQVSACTIEWDGMEWYEAKQQQMTWT